MGAFYRCTLKEFLTDDANRILGELTAGNSLSGFAELKHRQTKAWQREIEALKATSQALIAQDASCGSWVLLLVYPIPRRQCRIDAVVLAADVIVCLEFKTEGKGHSRPKARQVG